MSKETSKQSQERFKDNIVEHTPSQDQHSNYAERCKRCGRLISLCNCSTKDNPQFLNEKKTKDPCGNESQGH